MHIEILNFLFRNIKNSISAVLIAIGHVFTFNSKVVFEQPVLFYGFIFQIVILKIAFQNFYSLLNISNHIILTLDILAIFSFLILVLFQVFKDPENISI